MNNTHTTKLDRYLYFGNMYGGRGHPRAIKVGHSRYPHTRHDAYSWRVHKYAWIGKVDFMECLPWENKIINRLRRALFGHTRAHYKATMVEWPGDKWYSGLLASSLPSVEWFPSSVIIDPVLEKAFCRQVWDWGGDVYDGYDNLYLPADIVECERIRDSRRDTVNAMVGRCRK